MPRAPHLPAYPSAEVDPHIDPPQVQMPLAAPNEEPHIPMSAALVSDLVHATPVPATHVPATHSLPQAPTAPTGPNSFSPLVASIHITAQDFLAIMDAVRNFTVTSQSFATA